MSLLYVCIGILLTIVVCILAKQRTSNPEVTLYEISYRMLPFDPDLLGQIDRDSSMEAQATAHSYPEGLPADIKEMLEGNRRRELVSMRRDLSYRRELRNRLDDVKGQCGRASINAEMARNCARYYRWTAKMDQEQALLEEDAEKDPEMAQALREAQEVEQAIHRVLEAEKILGSYLRRARIIIWLWDMTGFHKRQWGPLPNITKLRIPQILEAYELLKLATVHLARTYGEAGISQQLAEQM